MKQPSRKNIPVIPTKTELDVLQVLWKHGPSTVRFVHDTLNQQKEIVQYTSTLKLMQVMKEKGLLERDESNMDMNVFVSLGCGMISGSIGAIMVFPLSLIRTR